MRMHLVVVGEPAWQLFDDGLRVRPAIHADIVALECAVKRLGHAVRLRAADGRGFGHQADVAGKGAGVARCSSCQCR